MSKASELIEQVILGDIILDERDKEEEIWFDRYGPGTSPSKAGG